LKFFNQTLLNRHFKKEDGWSSTGEIVVDNPPYFSYAESVDIAFRALKGTDCNLEFLAMVLHKEKKLIVATPLYVALAN
jgi:hypothetical protein